MPRLRPLIALAAGLLIAIALTGCGGDDKSSAAAAAGAGGQRINLSESAAKLSSLQSFRFSGSASLNYSGAQPSTAQGAFGGVLMQMLLDGLKDMKVEGAVVAPDQAQLSLKIAGQDFGIVQIKDQAWVKFMGGWTNIKPEDLGLNGGLNFSELAADQLPKEVVQAAKVSKEKVNGIDATRYSFDKAALQRLAQDAGAGQNVDSADMSLWLTDDGVPVKFTLKIKGTDDNGGKIDLQAEFEVSDLNGNISIKAPK
jgi:hypothetical protein